MMRRKLKQSASIPAKQKVWERLKKFQERNRNGGHYVRHFFVKLVSRGSGLLATQECSPALAKPKVTSKQRVC